MTKPKSVPRLGEPSPHILMRRWITEEEMNRLAREEYHRIRRRARAHQANRQDAERWERAA